MKKLLLLVAMATVMLGVSAQNPYAYKLSTTHVSETSATFNYSLNAPATSVVLKFYNGDAEVGSITMPAEMIVAGDHSYIVNYADHNLPKGVELTWKMIVSGEKVTAPVELTDKVMKFYSPAGVAVDVNPESDYFGTMYVTESSLSSKSEYFTTVANGTNGIGLYAMDPRFNVAKDANDKYGFNCGMQSSTSVVDWRPARMHISDDGRMFILSHRVNTGYPLYELNRETMTVSPVFEGTLDTSTGIVTNGDVQVAAGAGVGFDVIGSGDNLKLLMMTCTPANTTGPANYKTHEYDLGSAATWGEAPSRRITAFDGKAVNNAGINLCYDGNGGAWLSQWRGAPTANEPSYMHADLATNEADVVEYDGIYSRNGGMAFNADHTLMVRGEGYNKTFAVYSVENGQLTKLYEYSCPSFTGWNQFAFDYANNLIACDNSAEVFGMIQLPLADDVATPAAAKYNFTVPAPVYSVAGAPKELFNADNAWDPANVNSEMALDDQSGLYTFTGGEAELSAGSKVEFKVVENHSWDVSYGVEGNNVEIEVPADGIYTLTVTFDAETGTVRGVLNLVQAVYGKMYILGEVNGNNWSATEGVEMTTEDGKVYTANVLVIKPENAAPMLKANNNQYAYFSFSTKLADPSSSDPWGDIASSRIGAVSEPSADNPNGDFFINGGLLGQDLSLEYNTNPHAFRLAEGNYQIVLDKENMTMSVTGTTLTGIDDIEGAADVVSIRYYNLQGVESATPFDGMNVVVKQLSNGQKVVTKQMK